jgi:chemotaxis signal transduction protein
MPQLTEMPPVKELIEDNTLYLSLILSIDQQVLIPSHQIVEIITISPTQITAIPQITKPIMGIYSWRGEVLWVIDGASMLGETAFCDQHFWKPKYSIFIIRESGEHIGVMVPDVGNLGQRSRFCNDLNGNPNNDLNCPLIVDLSDRVRQLRHQLRATWN